MKNKRGFTLIELLVTIGLIVAVATLMYTFLMQGFSLYTMQNQESQKQSNMRQVLSDITNRVRLSEADDISYSAGVLTVGDDSYSFSSTEHKVMRNGSMLAADIRSFTVSLTVEMLEITITNMDGTSLSTSLYLGRV